LAELNIITQGEKYMHIKGTVIYRKFSFTGIAAAFLICCLPFLSEVNGQETASENKGTSKIGVEMSGSYIDSLSWLVGHWYGQGLGGTCEELWSRPVDGSMMGMFRFIKDGKPGFYEFMVITEDKDCVRIKIKHFNPDLTGWESKDDYIEFPFVSCSSDEFIFDGLIFRRIEADSINISLVIKKDDGSTEEHKVELQRVRE
jgi:hypothetical protein